LLINFIYGWRCAKQNELANLVIRLLLPGMGTTQLNSEIEIETETHSTWLWKEAAIES